MKSEEVLTFRQSLSEFIIKGNHAFNFVEVPAFIRMIKSLSPKEAIPSRYTIQRDVIQLFIDNKKKLIEIIKKIDSNVAITTDIWTSLANDPFIAVTAHFFLSEKLRHVLLEFAIISHQHNAEQIKYMVQCVLEEYCIINNVISLTTDNAKNNISGINQFKDFLKYELFIEKEIFHLPCFGHVLNLCVQEGIQAINSTLNTLRNSSLSVKSSSKQVQVLHETSIALKQNYTKLKRDTNVRWNSTYIMIERALKMKRALRTLSNEEESNVFTKNKITDNEWEILSLISEFLKPFYEATLMVSQQSYPSLCVVIPLFDILIKHLRKEKNSSKTVLKDCASMIEEKFLKYENKLKNKLSLFAVILVPRLNIQYFKDSLTSTKFQELKTSFIDYSKQYYSNSSAQIKEISNENSSLLHSIYKKRKLTEFEEIERYFEMPQQDSKVDLINWWTTHKCSFPNLYKMANDILNIPATSVPSEQIFSKSGDVITKKRNRLSKDSIQAIMCADSMLKFFNQQ
jgi:hypothetical protein